MVDLEIEGYSEFIWTRGAFRYWRLNWIYLDFMVDLDIEGYSFSLMCWIFAMVVPISFTWAVNITYKSDFMVDLDIEVYIGFIWTLWWT